MHPERRRLLSSAGSDPSSSRTATVSQMEDMHHEHEEEAPAVREVLSAHQLQTMGTLTHFPQYPNFIESVKQCEVSFFPLRDDQ